jgi:hypothetical protein
MASAAEKSAIQVQEKSGDLKKKTEILKKNKALLQIGCDRSGWWGNSWWKDCWANASLVALSSIFAK